MIRCAGSLALLVAAVLLPACSAAPKAQPLERIAFGSCAQQKNPQPIWDHVVAGKPQLYLGLGDNIYADTSDMQVMRDKYALLAAQPGWQKLRNTAEVFTVWDDHDYGINDAGVEYARKQESQEIFLKFFDEPAGSPRSKREGVYGSRSYGPPGKRVQVILLDTRYFRSPLKALPKEQRRKGIGPYLPTDEPGATVLGEAQWRWLENELKQPADLRIIGSSIQVLANEHQWEKWGNHPAERQRLLKLLGEAGGCVILSGDRHHCEIDRSTEGPYPLYDVTSSGLNQSAHGNELEPNKYRVGPIYVESNYGTLNINWTSRTLTMAVHDINGNVVSQQTVRLAALQPKR